MTIEQKMEREELFYNLFGHKKIDGIDTDWIVFNRILEAGIKYGKSEAFEEVWRVWNNIDDSLTWDEEIDEFETFLKKEIEK